MKKLILAACICVLSAAFVAAEEANTARADDSTCKKGQWAKKGGHGKGMRMMGFLRENDPEKFKELMKLRDENPEEFDKQRDSALASVKAEFERKMLEIRDLVRKYRESRNDADKEAIRAKIEENMKARLEAKKKEVADMESKLQAMVDERLNEILEKAQKHKEGPRKNKKDKAEDNE